MRALSLLEFDITEFNSLPGNLGFLSLLVQQLLSLLKLELALLAGCDPLSPARFELFIFLIQLQNFSVLVANLLMQVRQFLLLLFNGFLHLHKLHLSHVQLVLRVLLTFYRAFMHLFDQLDLGLLIVYFIFPIIKNIFI